MVERSLKLIASLYVRQYKTDAKLFIEDPHPSGKRHLVAQYKNAAHAEFSSGIPDDWSEVDVIDLLLWPMKNSRAPYPAWEVPARAFGSPVLFRFWQGEKPGR
jgi:hypothetical protein